MGDQGSIAFCGLSPHISKVFDMTGFLKLFLVYPSQDSALSAMA
jgi:anti-anti-sigma regulatory factor